jgi:hypothetical protein
MEETFSVTFSYDSTRGVFTGWFTNGVSFDFIAATDSPLPAKLRNALQALMSKSHTEFKKSANLRETTDEEWEEILAKIKKFEETNGVTRYSKPKNS